jgi:phosphate transport system substrate-binding protein
VRKEMRGDRADQECAELDWIRGVDLRASNNITYGSVKNSSGRFIKANLASVTDAAAVAAKTMPDDFRVSITNPAGNKAYPIATFTWLLIPQKFSDASKRDARKGFLKWALNDGQGYVESLSYANYRSQLWTKN